MPAGPARCQSGFNPHANRVPPADVRDSARFHFSLRPRRIRGLAASLLSPARHAAAPRTGAVSAAATHPGLRPTMRPRRTALVAAPFACRHRGLPHPRDGGARVKSAARWAAAGPAGRVDDGWPAAPGWARRKAGGGTRIEAAGRSRARRHRRGVGGPREIVAIEAAKAQDRLRAIKPVPYVPDRVPVLTAIQGYVAVHGKPAIVWIADGVNPGHARDFAGKLTALSGELDASAT